MHDAGKVGIRRLCGIQEDLVVSANTETKQLKDTNSLAAQHKHRPMGAQPVQLEVCLG